MAASSSAMAVLRRGLLGLSVLAVVLAAGLGVLLWQAVELSSVAQVAARVDELKPVATGIRLALIGLVAALWPWLIGLAHRAGHIGEEQRDDLLALVELALLGLADAPAEDVALEAAARGFRVVPLVGPCSVDK